MVKLLIGTSYGFFFLQLLCPTEEISKSNRYKEIRKNITTDTFYQVDMSFYWLESIKFLIFPQVVWRVNRENDSSYLIQFETGEY